MKILHERAHGTSMCREQFRELLDEHVRRMAKWRNEQIAVLCDEALEADEPKGIRLAYFDGGAELVMASPTPDGLVELFIYDEAEVRAASL